MKVCKSHRNKPPYICANGLDGEFQSLNGIHSEARVTGDFLDAMTEEELIKVGEDTSLKPQKPTLQTLATSHLKSRIKNAKE